VHGLASHRVEPHLFVLAGRDARELTGCRVGQAVAERRGDLGKLFERERDADRTTRGGACYASSMKVTIRYCNG